MKRAVYIHIPFCKSICSYCDFCKVLIKDEWVSSYLKALSNEVDEFYLGDEVKSIYIGGGTPSALKLIDLLKLFEIVKKFKRSPDCEVTFECNLNDINDTLLKVLKENNVNRISIGIESFNPRLLKIMHRESNFKDAYNKIKLCKYYHIDNINVDLMYGIEGQSIDELKVDLKLFLKLPITHISTYSLIVEDNTLVNIKNIGNVSEDLEAQMYDLIVKKLKSNGFNQYEVSNFSKDGFKSIHNLTYWHNEEYYGFGLNASGFIDDIRYTNTKSLTDYFDFKYNRDSYIVTKKQKMDDELMLGLRLVQGININEFNDKYQEDIFNIYPIKPLINNKDLILKNNNLFINPKKRYVMNSILLKMI